MNQRDLYKALWNRLSPEKAMIMVAGPRQAGKTTFAREIIARDFPDVIYFNWDLPVSRKKILTDPEFFTKQPRSALTTQPLVIFDELHKYRHWKNYLKGIYDQFSGEYKFLVTGSGRLEFSRKTGDSLAGRFLKFSIFPFTLAEFTLRRMLVRDFIKNPFSGADLISDGASRNVFESLWNFSGFPEPFLKGDQAFWLTWSSVYSQQIVRDDLRSVADLRNLDLVELLFSLLSSKIGSPLSINNLAGDLQVAFDTVKKWLLLFDSFYLTFRISSWTAKVSRSILKEKKLYLFNFPAIEDEGARFENLVALELLRAVETWNDAGEGKFGLHYVRNRNKQEVDFLLTENNRPFLLVETKLTEETPSPTLRIFQETLNVPAVQLVKKEGVKKFFKDSRKPVLVITAHHWLASLP